MTNAMQTLDIAVVIVTYKTARLTIDALRSLESERRVPDLRIRAIVVDNASGDLPEIAQAVSQNTWSSWVSLVAAPKNGGFAYGNNLGIEHAYLEREPAYVYLLNPDAQVRPGAIAELARFLEARPDVGIAGSSFERPDGNDWPIAFRFPTRLSEVEAGLQWGLVTRLLHRWVVVRRMTNSPQQVDWISGASMLIRRAVLESIGGLDENYFLYFEETDFCYRARRAGFSTWYVPQSRVMHMGGQSTLATDSGSPKRLPAYWFESRRRYFAVTLGVRGAIAVDVAALVAHSLGALKRIALGRRRSAVPHLIRDLVWHSALCTRNRVIPAARCELSFAKTKCPAIDSS